MAQENLFVQDRNQSFQAAGSNLGLANLNHQATVRANHFGGSEPDQPQPRLRIKQLAISNNKPILRLTAYVPDPYTKSQSRRKIGFKLRFRSSLVDG
jgi:hypothetical protein